MPASGGEAVLPPCVVPALDEARESDSDMDADLDPAVATEDLSCLEKWQRHPNYEIGMRMAQLSTFWITHGLPVYKFPSFVSWLHAQSPGMMGNLNHSEHFLAEFASSLGTSLKECTIAALHTIVPALGLPTCLTRVIDIVTIAGHSLMVVIHIYTDEQGRLMWNMLDCPDVSAMAESQVLASGNSFRFHSAERLVPLVHSVEDDFCVRRDNRKHQLVLTVADQAMAGPNSTQFVAHEAVVDNLACDPLKEGVCAFHVSDCVGGSTDKAFAEVVCQDRFLRLVRHHFNWGTGRLILRSIAQAWSQRADDLIEEGATWSQRAAKADLESRPVAAQRLRHKATQAQAEADTMVRCGWTQWKPPLAPSADGTRKVVWQSACRERLYDIYALVFWGIKARMLEAKEAASSAMRAEGKTPSEDTGLRTKRMEAWRSMGRMLLDIQMLVFNMGRCDFRRKHIVAYAMIVQSSTHIGRTDYVTLAKETSDNMFLSIGVLTEMIGIVRLVEQILTAPQWVVSQAPDGSLKPVSISKTTIWAMCRTLLVHKCWRDYHKLAIHLSEILLGGSFQGIRLQCSDFDSPGKRGQAQSQPVAAPSAAIKRLGVVERRRERFKAVLVALERLRDWARQERATFMQQLLGWAPGQNVIFANKHGLPKMHVNKKTAGDLISVDALHHEHVDEGEDIDMGEDIQQEITRSSNSLLASGSMSSLASGSMELEGRCAFAPSKITRKRKADALEWEDVLPPERTGIGHSILTEKELHAATKELAEACESFVASKLSSHSAQRMDTEVLPSIVSLTTDNLEEEAAIDIATSDSDDDVSPTSGGSNLDHMLASGSVTKNMSTVANGSVQESSKPKQPPLRSFSVRKTTAGAIQFRGLEKGHVPPCVVKCGVGGGSRRREFLMHVGVTFGADLLSESSLEPRDYRESLQAIYTELNKKAWGLAPGSLPSSVCKNPPPEIYKPCTWPEFYAQYTQFREWVRGFLRYPYAGEFFHIEGYMVQKINVEGGYVEKPFFTPKSDIKEAGQWQQWVPPRGTQCRSNIAGKCVVLSPKRSPNMSKLYAYVMTTPIIEVRSVGVWNVLVAWHRCVHMGSATESLAECAGSVLRHMEMKWKGCHPRHVRHLIWAANLRMAGLRGTGGEEGILATALNIHFKKFGPEHWHFRKTSAKGNDSSVIKKHDLKESVRRQALPAWIDKLWFDLAKAHQVRVAANLGQKGLNVAGSGLQPASSGGVCSARRAELGSVTAKHHPGKLPGEFWLKLGLPWCVPAHMRPKAARR